MSSSLPPEVVRVAELLAKGMTDKVIAQRESVTKRTVRRRVARLLAEVNAVTRFQAGYQLGKRGLPAGRGNKAADLWRAGPKDDTKEGLVSGPENTSIKRSVREGRGTG